MTELHFSRAQNFDLCLKNLDGEAKSQFLLLTTSWQSVSDIVNMEITNPNLVSYRLNVIANYNFIDCLLWVMIACKN